MKICNLLLLALFAFPSKGFGQNLQEVTDNGNTTNQLIIIDPQGDAFRSFSVKRFNGTVTTAAGLANNKVCGNINIGTAAAQKQLNVNGNVKARKVKVTLTDWPDYVFARDYALMSLQQLDAFIAANRHLPGVPSAETVKREGLELGENQAVLLRKIEELTLYILQQNKKQEAMEKKMREMEEKLNAL